MTDRLARTVAELKAAVESGMVPNAMFVAAKDTINREVERAAEAFLSTGPHATNHNQSDWWLAAYRADAFVSGAHNVPAALKRAEKVDGLRDYAAFLRTELLPVHALMQSAKPLIVKRGDMPKVRTAAQVVDDAKRMTCQCCGRRILAETGTVAHHGYERPGTGWQTSSCMGAKEMPFEVSRDRLGVMIEGLRNNLAGQVATRDAVETETAPVTYRYTVGLPNGHRDSKSASFTRDTFDAVIASLPRRPGYFGDDALFDGYKRRDLASRDSQIRNLTGFIAECQARFDGWKQTHRREGDEWVTL